MSKWYGSLTNRFEEGRNYNQDKLIHEGDDITMYYYSDCTCYYVTKVVDQKHIFVKPYYVCADHSKEGGMGHQDWMYFKTKWEHDEYLREYFPDLDLIPEEEDVEEEWTFKYGKWKETYKRTQKDVDKLIEEMRETYNHHNTPISEEELRERAIDRLSKTELNKKALREGRDTTVYYDLSGKVSFGVRNYHYDWEF